MNRRKECQRKRNCVTWPIHTLQLKICIFVTSLFCGEQLLVFAMGTLCACQRQDKQCLHHFYSHKTLGYPKMLILRFCVIVKKLFFMAF